VPPYLTGIIACQIRKENPTQTLSDFNPDSFVVHPSTEEALTLPAIRPYDGKLPNAGVAQW
jgi:hypothetical protein